MASPDNFDPLIPIPNDTFSSVPTWDFYTPTGTLIYQTGFTISPVPGTVSVSQVGPPIIGTVTQVNGGIGIQTSPVAGITVSGSVSLTPAPSTLTPGSYSYAGVTVNEFGRIVTAYVGTEPIVSALADFPVIVTGAAPTLTVDIAAGSTTQPGAVQLNDTLLSTSSSLALTANQGYILNQDVNSVNISVEGQFYAGLLSVVTGAMVSTTLLGSAAGFTIGLSLPLPGPVSSEGFVVASDSGPYTPPGGTTSYNVKAGDRFYCGLTSWVFIRETLDYPYATTTVPGLVQLARPGDVPSFTDNRLVVTPASLANIDASTTSRGFVRLASDSETLALSSPVKAVTPANLNALAASPLQRGIVDLTTSPSSPSITSAASAAALNTVYVSAILKSQITQNADLIVGLSNATPTTLSKGTEAYNLQVDILNPTGLDWKPVDAPANIPVGTVFWFSSGDTLKLPTNWAYCNGATASSAAESSPGVPNPYYALFQIIGYTYGGTGSTFNLPNLLGSFARGWSGSGGTSGPIDSPRVFGSSQPSSVVTHTHVLPSLSHSDHTLIISDPGHNHFAKSGTVIGSGPGWFGNKGTNNGGGENGQNITNVSLLIDSGLTDTYTSLTNTAPTPADNTRPVNMALCPIIKYTYGNETIPGPPTRDYYLSTTPIAATVNTVITTTVQTINVPVGTTLYWELSGAGIDASFFTPAGLTGTTTVGGGGVATIVNTFAAALPAGGPYTLQINIYTDATRLDLVGNPTYVTVTP